MGKKNFEAYYGPEKEILSMKMAAFLLLNGCKLNHTRKDLVKPHRFIYFFAKTPQLDMLMSKYTEYRDALGEIKNDTFEKYIRGVDFGIEEMAAGDKGEQK